MKVFVSSTYLDLKEHRKAVDEIINRLRAQYRGMEYFGARPYEPKRVCFEEIKQCEVFIGIYAHRYGWIPEDDDISIIEQEFEFAKRTGLDCYCYIIDANFPWPPLHIEHQSYKKLSRFLKKINNLVRSVFTTPDNLAKQVAADLQVAIQRSSNSFNDKNVLQSLQTFCTQEIITTIGPKYIKDLYVGRALDQSLQRELERLKLTNQSIKSIKADCQDACELLESISASYLKKAELGPLKGFIKSLSIVCRALEGFKELHSIDEKLCYPAQKLHAYLDQAKNAVLDAQRYDPRKYLADIDFNKRWDSVTSTILTEISNLNRTLRPISLVVDRAGGGKTNLLCRLVEEVGKRYPCLFIAAKSISYPSDKAIVDYLSSIYPIGNDPIEVALGFRVEQSDPVVVIVDGINENYDPIGFNTAFKSLVRRYYGHPVLYIVSCRDIYWKYFEDEWWLSHCCVISRDELYEFTNQEFRKALPLYLRPYDIEAFPVGDAREQLHHPLLLRFYCEAFKGLPGKKAKLGRIDDIRLLELFDTYCHKKFSQIKERLGLISDDDVLGYLQLIGRMMLLSHTRLLAVKKVAQKVKREFNEDSLRSVKSLYVQILDEDILLEQKPTGLQMELKVSFVYDEFMEFIIARTLWSDISEGAKSPKLLNVEYLAKTLLAQERHFISVLGVVVYLGELLAMISPKSALKYVDWLVTCGRESLACRLVIRWPKQTLDDSVFQKLININKNGKSEQVRREAWKAMERICLHHWNIFFAYVTSLQLSGAYRPTIVFSMLGRVNGGLNAQEQVRTIRWIVKIMNEKHYILQFKECADYTSGIVAIKRILKRMKSSWNKHQIKEIETLINQVTSL